MFGLIGIGAAVYFVLAFAGKGATHIALSSMDNPSPGTQPRERTREEETNFRKAKASKRF